MDDYRQDWQSFKPSHRGSYMDMDMQMLHQLAGTNPIMSENFKSTDVTAGTFLDQPQPEFPASSIQIFPSTTFPADHMNEVLVLHDMGLTEDVWQENKETKVVEQSKSSSKIIASTTFENESKVDNDTNKKESSEKGKKRSCNEKEVEKSEEGIHVRARRGQAIDSHSLAERVRRQKINSRLRRLKDLVPGCYKTMGMAAMLDEIINYIHSLQNQVEFLSLELTSASSSYNNSETRAIRRSAGALFQELERPNHLFSSQLLMD